MAANTYVSLVTTTVDIPTTSVNFSNIPLGYTDLVMVINLANTSNTSLWINVGNNIIDTGNNYSGTRLWGNGSAVGTDRQSNYGNFIVTVSDGKTTTINFQNYSNTNIKKIILARHSSPYSTVGANVGMWNNTLPINSITVNSNLNMAVGTTISIYGIKSQATAATAKATGGNIITSDSQYWYHAFTSSGTFTPSESINADILVVAGGGGGGGHFGGGGGGGGVVGYSSYSLLSGNSNTVTIGAGGAGGIYTSSPFYGYSGSNSRFAFSTAALGGGGGGTRDKGLGTRGQNGGSGGGGTEGNDPGGSLSNQGSSGGYGYNVAPNYPAGGGGGAGGVGISPTSGSSIGGNGGNGATYNSTIGGFYGPHSFINSMGLATGTGQLSAGNYYFAGGGGGGSAVSPGGTGGLGGGGNAGTTAAAGTANTGGGGAGKCISTGVGGTGGSGIVIVRYPR